MSTFPVLLMNPTEPEDQDMPARKTTARRKTTAARRRPARKAPARRRTTRRRRKNPAMDAKGTMMAAAAGAAAGAGAYALEGADLKPLHKALIAVGAGLTLGYVATGYQKPVGFALTGAGLAIGTKAGLDMYKASTPSEKKTLGAIMGPHTVAQLNAVEAPLGAVHAHVGAYEASMS